MPLRKKSGIYQILNKINEKFYIGQSIDLKHRRNEHWNQLKNNNHPNILLQRAWNKYGEDAFIFNTLLLCKISELDSQEQNFLDTLKPAYNIAKDVRAPRRGLEVSEETRRRISEATRGLHQGSQSVKSKLREEDVLEIYRELEYNVKYSIIAERHGVTPTTIRDIDRGVTWPWLKQEEDYYRTIYGMW